jgi:cobalt/nickel transport system ATP-binding protein
LLECRGVCFSYQEGTQALQEVDFAAEAGEFVALLASNGSGKTTLIKVLAGLLKPQAGVVLVDGLDIGRMSDRQFYQRVGLMLQNPKDQLFGATVEEDVAFGPRNLDLSEEEVQGRVAECLEAVGALHLRTRAIHHLSFGEQKRVALAGVLAMGPSILLLDEATAGLDPAGEDRMIRLLYRLNRERGITVIFATHSVDILPLFASRICVLDRGRVLKHQSAPEIFREPHMLVSAGLRLPYITALFHDLKHLDRLPIDGLPLTVREARQELLSLLPEDLRLKDRREAGHA